MPIERIDVHAVHDEFLQELFGDSVPVGDDYRTTRTAYQSAMHKVQDKYGLKQGHPDFPGWLMTMLAHSPAIIEDDIEGE